MSQEAECKEKEVEADVGSRELLKEYVPKSDQARKMQ